MDFHSENIIVDDERKNFVLLIGGKIFGANRYVYGDVYYDLANFNTV